MRNLNGLATFVQVAKYESVTKAAKKLHLTQQAVTSQVKKLEEELGIILFKRAHKKIFLTQEGMQLLEIAEQHLSNLEANILKVKNGLGTLQGSIVIGCSLELADLILTPIIIAFKEKHPEITIDLRLQDDPQTIDQVMNGRLDIGIVVFTTNHNLLDVTPFHTEAFATLASKNFIENNECISDYKDVISKDIIDYHPDCPSMKMWLSKNDKALIKSIDIKLASVAANDDRIIKKFVMANLGIANVPKQLFADELARGEVVEILPESNAISAGIDLISMKGRVMPAQISTFIEFIKLSKRF